MNVLRTKCSMHCFSLEGLLWFWTPNIGKREESANWADTARNFLGYKGKEDYFSVISTFNRFIYTNNYFLEEKKLGKTASK